MTIMPPMPMTARSTPASTGAAMAEVDSASDSIPLARAYCALGSIMEIAAE